MTLTELVALGVASAWLAALTLVVLSLVRQLGLVTLRLDIIGSQAPTRPLPDDGPPVGEALPDGVGERLPELALGRQFVLLISPTCMPCHELAPQLSTVTVLEPVTALVPGREELADELVGRLPDAYRVVRGPLATDLSQLLHMERTPSVLELRDGTVSGKAYLFNAADFQNLVDAGNGPTDTEATAEAGSIRAAVAESAPTGGR